jgi:hypothetical protein
VQLDPVSPLTLQGFDPEWHWLTQVAPLYVKPVLQLQL